MPEIQIALKTPHKAQAEILRYRKRFNVLKCGRRFGKCLDVYTPVLTFNRGWSFLKDIKKGDFVFSPSGSPVKVTYISPIYWDKECYNITFADGREIIADAGHRWITKTKKTSTNYTIKTTKDISETVIYKSENNHKIDCCSPIEFTHKNQPIPAYVLGVWLGDGHSNGTYVYMHENDIEIINRIRELGITIQKAKDKYAYSFALGIGGKRVDTFPDKIRKLNLYKNKHIPNIYKYGSIQQRTELLKGLMDTDGYCGKNGYCEFTSMSKKLADDVYDLVVSLGIKATINNYQAILNGLVVGIKYRVTFTSDIPVFYLKRKLERQRKKSGLQCRSRAITKVEKTQSVPVCCISVDSPDHLFLVSKSLIATHNTEIFQELASESIERCHTFAYFSPTYKDLYEVWHEIQRVFYPIIKTKSETVKQLIFINDAKVDFWSMEDPDSGRGRKYHRVVVDECEKAGKFKQAWEESIRATLTDYIGDAYLISTPKFGDTYFKQICHNQERLEDWKTFIYTTYDNPYIDRDEIEEARKLLGTTVFECEYLAKDLDGRAVNPFAMHFDEATNTCDRLPFNETRQLIMSVDFNLNPFCITFHHLWRDQTAVHWHVIDEAEIETGSLPAMIELIKTRYARQLPNCRITGDHMGVRGELGERDNASLYTQIKRGLNIRDAQVVTPANPTHENSRADVNYFLYHANKQEAEFDFKIYKNCKGTIRDFLSVQCDATGSIVKRDRKDLSQRADFIDTARYACNTFVKQFIIEHQKSLINKNKKVTFAKGFTREEKNTLIGGILNKLNQ